MPWLQRFGALSISLALASLLPQAEPFPGPAGQSANEPPPQRTPQLVPRSHQERELRYQTQHRIILNVHVSDASGKPSTQLKESDFTLIDDQKPHKLVDFRAVKGSGENEATHVILVFDVLNTSIRQLRYLVKETEKYLRQGDGPLDYPMTIGLFSGAGVDAGQPSRDRSTLLDEIRRRAADLHTTGCVEGGTADEIAPFPSVMGAGGIRASTRGLACKNQRFVSSVTALRRLAEEQVDIPGRAIIIWTGPGWPMLTDRGFSPDTPEMKENFFSQLVNVSTALREAQITLDAVALPGTTSDPDSPHALDIDFFEGVSTQDKVRAGNLGLHALAHQTGGQILASSNDIARDLAACIADAASYYVLTFDSPPAAAFGEYHSLAVQVDRPDLRVRTNTLYYAEQ